MMLARELMADVERINAAIEELFEKTDADFAPVLDAMRYSLVAPRAKRIRPALTIAFCRLFGGKDEAALPAAVALEMVHTYSLIHDDLPCMDNDELRRGRPTCHVAYGEATALLAGDALLTRAFEVLGENKLMSDRAVRDAVLVLSRAAGAFGMIGGQVIDLAGEKETLPLPLLLKLHKNKTGALIVAAATLGCLAAGLSLSDDRTLAAGRYAAGIGLAFQIVDDVIDATATIETAGKSVGSDQKQHKTTFLSYYTIEQAMEYAHQVTEQAKGEIAGFDGSDTLLHLADRLTERKF